MNQKDIDTQKMVDNIKESIEEREILLKELKEKYEKQGNKLWVIYYDQQFCKRTGITEKDIETLFAMYNIKFVESFTDPVYPPPAFYRKTGFINIVNMLFIFEWDYIFFEKD